MLHDTVHPSVTLSDCVGERLIRWKNVSRLYSSDYKRVWIDVLKLDAMLPLSPVGHVGFAGEKGIRGKYQGVDEYVRSGKTLSMPQAAIRSTPDNQRIVCLRDGRHRFAWMRDHGAGALPVAVLVGEAREVAEFVGTKDRICRVSMQYIQAWDSLSDMPAYN